MLHFGDLTVVCLHGHREVAHAQGPEGGEKLWRDIFPHLRRVEWAYTCRHGPHHLRHSLAVAHRLQHFFAAVCLPQRLILLLQPQILNCYFCGDMNILRIGFWLKMLYVLKVLLILFSQSLIMFWNIFGVERLDGNYCNHVLIHSIKLVRLLRHLTCQENLRINSRDLFIEH